MTSTSSLSSTIPKEPVDLQVQVNDDPQLPIEIEQEIFVLAYYTSAGTDRTTLLLVAKRTLEWLTRLIYHVVVIRDASVKPTLESLQRHGHQVRHLAMSSYKNLPYDEEMLLSLCPNLIDLACWYNSALVTEATDLFRVPLKRLTFHHIREFSTQLTMHKDTPHVQRWCSNLTHLAISTIRDSDPEVNVGGPVSGVLSFEWLTLFSNLTHFLTGNWNNKSVVREVLAAVSTLRVFILLLGQIQDPDKVFAVQNEGDSRFDHRVVTINGHMINDWMRSIEGKSEDMWVIAEREVEERKALRR